VYKDISMYICIRKVTRRTEHHAVSLRPLSFCNYLFAVRADESTGGGLCSANGVCNVCECDQVPSNYFWFWIQRKRLHRWKLRESSTRQRR